MSVKKEMTFGSVGRNHCTPRFTKTALLLVFSRSAIVRYNLNYMSFNLWFKVIWRGFIIQLLYLCEDFKLQFLLSLEFYRNLFLRL